MYKWRMYSHKQATTFFPVGRLVFLLPFKRVFPIGVFFANSTPIFTWLEISFGPSERYPGISSVIEKDFLSRTIRRGKNRDQK